MAVSIIALQRQMAELKTQVEQMRSSRPSIVDRLERMAKLARIIGQVLSTGWGQSALLFLMSIVAGIVKWLMGSG